MANPTDLENKLAAARTRLILDKPFLGALVLRLPMQAAAPAWCPTTATDARKFYYNPDYIDALNLSQVQFVLAHEALHCALSHFARRGHRNKMRWDMACDHAVNPLLLQEKLKAPPGVWVEEGYLGMTAEEIYPMIDENNSDEPMDGHLYDDHAEGEPPPSQSLPPQPPDPQSQQAANTDEGKGEQTKDDNGGHDPRESLPPPLSHEEREQLQIQWQQRLAGAAQQAKQAGKLGEEMARLVDHLLQPQLPWRMLLARYMSLSAHDDYSYMRPSRREGAAILPSLRSQQMNMVVALDVSGSVSDKEIAQCIAEVNAIKGQTRAQVTILTCDNELSSEALRFEAWEPCEPPKSVQGGRGTDFVPVFDWIAQQDTAPDVLLYFTDALGQFPAQMPSYPVVWLVKGRADVPWGQRIQLN